MVNKTISATLIIMSAGCHPVFADVPCEYDKTVETNWTQQIEKTSNIDKKVFPYVDDTRKCIMTMDVTIDGQTYDTEGSYVFGPDMSENNACEQATINAKKSIISEVSPEILSAKTEMNCSTEPQKSVEVVQSLPQKTVVQEGVPVVTERVISTKVIDTTPNRVVYLPNSVSKGINLGMFTITIDPHRHKRGKCYANWETGGTDCY